MSTGTITPTPFQTVEGYDADGLWGPIAGCLIYTYDAGTMDPATTYSNVGLTIANSNPIEADASGRWSAFLSPGNNYKFYYCLPVTPIPDPSSPPSAFRTADNIAATPLSSQALDITGLFGETVSAGDCIYLSDGSGGKTTGRWYLADSTNAYSSVLPSIGFAVADTNLGDTGSIRQAGQIGQGSVSVGATYFVGTAGAITLTAPAFARVVGQADSGTDLVVACEPTLQAGWDIRTCEGRLTLTTAVPITTTDVTAATSIFFTPYAGNRIAFYDGTRWVLRTFTEISIAVPATTTQMYDIFVFDNAGTLTLELTAWTNDTTRATAIVTQDGVLVKSGTVTRRYLGSFRTTGSSGQTEDSLLKRYLWNYYNRVPRVLQRFESTASWTYTTATVRQANGSTSNQVDLVVGVSEAPMDLLLQGSVEGATHVSAGIGENATTTYAVGQYLFVNSSGSAISVRLIKYPAIGRNFYSWNEWSTAVGTTTWSGAIAAAGSNITCGLTGTILG